MKDNRSHPRYCLRWPAALVLDGDAGSGPLLEGRLHDLSVGGASVLIDLPLPRVERLTLILLPPPLVCGRGEKSITVHSKVIYSVLSCGHDCFRAGLEFVRFEADGRHLLEERLVHHAPVFERAFG